MKWIMRRGRETALVPLLIKMIMMYSLVLLLRGLCVSPRLLTYQQWHLQKHTRPHVAARQLTVMSTHEAGEDNCDHVVSHRRRNYSVKAIIRAMFTMVQGWGNKEPALKSIRSRLLYKVEQAHQHLHRVSTLPCQ